ncbi:hypothetical protein [Sinorhizobium meliloti]|uniref:hypothetical protein n=1 Tax=Rhizobium meliloti TaxID=382 RepID=UPI0001E4B035|nr:hypothetical protein [Sinorhizobium meliloti]AEG53179.1 hypothetical protein Sinme_1434 [Sinorhizobium meliloti AK83]MDE4591105.1 hypothetical protein [Sinorhizobium meliloti]SEI56649.1 hypothetical protein SAMN04244575_01083 [Sinorhizobium meliloti]
MSLEAALLSLKESIDVQNGLLSKMLAKAGTASAPTEGDEGKTTATRGKGKGKTAAKEAETDTNEGEGNDDTGLSHDEVKKLAGNWLAEFKANEKDPETEARRDAIKGALAKLTGKEKGTIADVPAADLHRVVAWLDKQKAKGRLTPEPTDEDGSEEDGDEI